MLRTLLSIFFFVVAIFALTILNLVSLERDCIHTKNLNVTHLALTASFFSCYSSDNTTCHMLLFMEISVFSSL